MTLIEAKRGERVTVASIALSEETRGRLYAFGILPGVALDVIDPSLHGAALVSCRGNRLALGSELAEGIHLCGAKPSDVR